ncbi:unnamed protein product [Eruca vesicaria subsp. sativa]|uniref:DUF1653 domain-containing protein n=1 Tax=Eruca vesicaria subsp. sativa TaxID=29727 RepID=A0ABC8IWK2_ERUVS|nr:unnamed protein product [Eruca vesicaria subsp. sativa]
MGVVFKTEAHFDDPEEPKIIKSVATGKHAYAFREGFDNKGGHRQVIVVLKMWRVRDYLPYSGPVEEWLQTEGDLSYFRFNSRLPEVE